MCILILHHYFVSVGSSLLYILYSLFFLFIFKSPGDAHNTKLLPSPASEPMPSYDCYLCPTLLGPFLWFSVASVQSHLVSYPLRHHRVMMFAPHICLTMPFSKHIPFVKWCMTVDVNSTWDILWLSYAVGMNFVWFSFLVDLYGL